LFDLEGDEAMALTGVDLDALLDGIKFDDKGLASAIVQDAATGEVVMFAFLNREALRLTFETGKMHYWSRSRQKLWLKGETSGHVQTVHEVRVDCDSDALVFKISQHGGACHTGFYSCFYRKLTEGGWVEQGQKVFDPAKVY
jgi:phosphoribosyl-AMP cyclohydrolase